MIPSLFPSFFSDPLCSYLAWAFEYGCRLENKEPTNILKLTKAIKREDDEGVQQVIFYDSGVGTQGTVDKYVGGAFGVGIEQNIKELYTFLALNYDDGDEVYLFGFSRGSYTVRSLVGLIYESGLCRREEIHAVNGAYELYRKNEDVESEDAQDFRKLHGDRIPIKLLVCFDTVASLGVPLGKKFFGNFNKNHFGFHTTTLNDSVENAIHMLSIDEDRSGKFREPPFTHTVQVLQYGYSLFFQILEISADSPT